MSGPGVTSACIFSFWIDMPVCDPPFGNDTHVPHAGRMHSCPNTDVLMIIAAKTIKPRIHFLLFKAARRENNMVRKRPHLEAHARFAFSAGPPRMLLDFAPQGTHGRRDAGFCYGSAAAPKED
jgi:hypothetical protein